MNPVKDSALVQSSITRSANQTVPSIVNRKAPPVADSPVKRKDSVAADAAKQAQEAQTQQRASLNDALTIVNEQGASYSPALKFEKDEDSGVVIIKVMNRETGEVIRQLPPEAVVKASEDGGLPALVTETV